MSITMAYPEAKHFAVENRFNHRGRDPRRGAARAMRIAADQIKWQRTPQLPLLLLNRYPNSRQALPRSLPHTDDGRIVRRSSGQRMRSSEEDRYERHRNTHHYSPVADSHKFRVEVELSLLFASAQLHFLKTGEPVISFRYIAASRTTL